MKEKILIVEDNSIAREGMRLLLEVEGYDISTAHNGEKALELLSINSYDLILSDIVMPEISGIDLLLTVKKEWPEIIVILITAFGAMDTAIQALRLGAYDYILKPCGDEELKIRIKRGLERKQLGQIVKEKNRQDAVFEVVAGLADTLNNLLAGISGNHEMLRTYFSNDKDTTVIESFQNASICINKSARIVENLCTTVSLFKKDEFRPYDLQDAFLGIKMQFDVERFEFHVPNKLPWVFGGERLINAFTNIIQNALEATREEDKIKIIARIDSTGEFVEIVFVDHGYGIEPGALTKVFLPFFTVKNGDRAGLGLWVAYQTVTYFKGIINIASEENIGTTVTVYLPIYR